ncbi:DUF6933 domain-containing protein [Paenibacillus lemnae]|uniref:DUF6933 domain-containing protein n=1 Tax=Paenibacillus lemnae TaxID=1330551 RepID=A0A848M908_PAELE|nr:hypothetical protein [Paenibacillus lemnae]NMO97145.1 hypothetical protein [Paenibacillus lemnae]
MLALRFTQKLLKDMKTAPVDIEEIDPLFSWHVNILQLRKKHIIFVNDSSQLCLVIDGIRSSQVGKLQEKFLCDLKDYLQLEGIKKHIINQYFLEAGEIRIGKTNSRRVIGTMNEMVIYSKNMTFEHTYDLSAWLNKMIYKPIDYEKPIHVFKQEIEKRYS